MKKITIVTATRAEYGILKPLIIRLNNEEMFDIQLVVTGTHLLEEYGKTVNEIERDNIPIKERISILDSVKSARNVSETMANAIYRFAEYFQREKPNLLIVLGDRTEILGICCAAMNENIAIAHLHGGELTEGAVDDCVRHAITKMSYFHFPSTEVYRKRIIQMGENPERVFNVGALGVENILKTKLMSEQDLREDIGISEVQNYVVVTFHPVTLEDGTEKMQVEALMEAMERKPQYFYLITKANADVGGNIVNGMLEQFSNKHKNVKLVSSLGMLRYLSALKYSSFVMGNSSSGIIEAPVLGIPTVNIGDRQKGRLMPKTVIQCNPSVESIEDAMVRAAMRKHIISNIYGNGDTSERIVSILKEELIKMPVTLKKSFYDLHQN